MGGGLLDRTTVDKNVTQVQACEYLELPSAVASHPTQDLFGFDSKLTPLTEVVTGS